MSVIRNALARILRSGDKVRLHFTADRRTAAYVRPLIEKLVADDEDGDTYRTAMVSLHRSERPPLAVYNGEVSSCRIDGPVQWAGDYPFPLGGLVLSPGVTAHLDPFEACDFRDHVKAAIERAILAWLSDNGYRDGPPVSIAFDRRAADHKAKAMIAEWAARKEGMSPVAEALSEGPDHV